MKSKLALSLLLALAAGPVMHSNRSLAATVCQTGDTELSIHSVPPNHAKVTVVKANTTKTLQGTWVSISTPPAHLRTLNQELQYTLTDDQGHPASLVVKTQFIMGKCTRVACGFETTSAMFDFQNSHLEFSDCYEDNQN